MFEGIEIVVVPETERMGLFEASVTREFRARHSILIEEGRPENAHEHAWRFTATFRSPVLSQPQAVVVDFVQVACAMEAIASELEGVNLNDLAYFSDGMASAERVAQYLALRLSERMGDSSGMLYRLEVSEAPGCAAAYYPRTSR